MTNGLNLNPYGLRSIYSNDPFRKRVFLPKTPFKHVDKRDVRDARDYLAPRPLIKNDLNDLELHKHYFYTRRQIETLFPNVARAYDLNIALISPIESYPKECSGTGWIVSSEGHVLTNRHVLSNVCYDLSNENPSFGEGTKYRLGDGRIFDLSEAEIIDFDKELDLALIKIPGLAGKGFIQIEDRTPLSKEICFLIGNPCMDVNKGENIGVFSEQYVSIGNPIKRLLADTLIDVPFEPFVTDNEALQSSSGGSLVDVNGNCIGTLYSANSKAKAYSYVKYRTSFTISANSVPSKVAIDFLKRNGLYPQR